MNLLKAKKGTPEYEEWLRKYREKRGISQDTQAMAVLRQHKVQAETAKIPWQGETEELFDRLDYFKVEKARVDRCEPQSDSQIMDKLCSFDETHGSCVSQAYAFVGNRLGYDVTDYRGGKSKVVFAGNRGILALTKFFEGSISQPSRSDFDCAHENLAAVQSSNEDEEFFFTAGRHCAIVRKHKGQLQYMELQSLKFKGWTPLDDTKLAKRFECKSDNDSADRLSTLIPLSKFKEKQANFEELLSFLNTKTLSKKSQLIEDTAENRMYVMSHFKGNSSVNKLAEDLNLPLAQVQEALKETDALNSYASAESYEERRQVASNFFNFINAQ